MASYFFIGASGRDFPSDDGIHPSFTAQPGDVIEADENPDPRWFDDVDGNPNGNAQSTAPTITETTDAVTEGTE